MGQLEQLTREIIKGTIFPAGEMVVMGQKIKTMIVKDMDRGVLQTTPQRMHYISSKYKRYKKSSPSHNGVAIINHKVGSVSMVLTGELRDSMRVRKAGKNFVEIAPDNTMDNRNKIDGNPRYDIQSLNRKNMKVLAVHVKKVLERRYKKIFGKNIIVNIRVIR